MLVIHVSKHRIRHPCVKPLEHVLLVDGGIDPIFAVHDGNDSRDLRLYLRTVASQLSQFPSPCGFGIRTRQLSGFEEAMRVEDQLHRPDLGDFGRHSRRFAVCAIQVPSVFTVEHEDFVRILLHTGAVDPADTVLPHCRGKSWLSIELFLHRPVVPIHGPRVIGQRIDSRPVDVLPGLLLLAHRAVVGGS